MPNLTTTQLNQFVKETFDTVIHESFAFNTQTLKLFKQVTPEDVTSIGRYFTIQTKSNRSYGSQASEGGAFPATGRLEDVKALVNYRSQFSSFGFSGDVLDLANNKTLQDAFKRTVEDTTMSFDERQNFFLFGDGSGSLGTVSSISTNDITMTNTVALPFGSRLVYINDLINAYNVGGSAYRSGDMNVTAINRSTDVVSVDAAAASIAGNDVLVYKGSYGYAPQGIPYHVADSGTWLGLSRTTYPTLRSAVYDASSASLDWDMFDAAILKANLQQGDTVPQNDYKIIMHPVQIKNLKATARNASNVLFNAQIGGTSKADLGIGDVMLNGMSCYGDQWCAPSDVWGLRLSDWNYEQVAPRQLYKHNDGSVLIQSLASSTTYGDAKEGRVYARYNVVCKAPFRQFRIKNVNFSTSDTRIARV